MQLLLSCICTHIYTAPMMIIEHQRFEHIENQRPSIILNIKDLKYIEHQRLI